jgi:hypothetical protein
LPLLQTSKKTEACRARGTVDDANTRDETMIAKQTGCAAVVIAAWSIALSHAAAVGGQGVRFDSPGVLDLADRALKVDHGVDVPVAELAAADAEGIFAVAAIDEDKPALRFSDDEYACAKPSRRCSLEHERRLVETAGATVERDGKHLTVNPASGAPVTFIDWKQPAAKNADGDEETHWYLGRLPGSGYERVEVQFGHDAPGTFLVSSQSGKTLFVHNGSDLAVPSPDAKLLVTWNAPNPPLSIRVGALDAAGPRLELQCEAPADGRPMTAVFKGWHDAMAFDAVLEFGMPGKATPRTAVRLVRIDGTWQMQASDPARVAGSGFTCHAPTPSP